MNVSSLKSEYFKTENKKEETEKFVSFMMGKIRKNQTFQEQSALAS